MVNIRTPKWQQEVAFRAALEVIELARCYPDLESRLDGALDELAADAERLRQAISATSTTRAQRKSATARQRRVANRGCQQVRAFRRAIRLARPRDRALHRRFGIGERVNPGKVGSVAAALQMALDAAAHEPKAVAEASVLPEDLDALRGTLEALIRADSAQEATKVGAKHATAKRDLVQLKVEEAIGKVLAAAAVVFRDRPAIAAAFEAVVPGEGSGRPKATVSGQERTRTDPAVTEDAAGEAEVFEAA